MVDFEIVCRFLMGLFSYIWYTSLIRVSTFTTLDRYSNNFVESQENRVTVAQLLSSATNSLSREQQMELFQSLKEVLAR